MSVNLLREKQMQAAELEVLYWEKKLRQLGEEPKGSAKSKETLERGEAQGLYWREGELKIATERAVSDFKKRLVEELGKNYCCGGDYSYQCEYDGGIKDAIKIVEEME